VSACNSCAILAYKADIQASITAFQLVHGCADVFTVLVAVAFHHRPRLESGKYFDRWQINARPANRT